jgi:hypothetical protein
MTEEVSKAPDRLYADRGPRGGWMFREDRMPDTVVEYVRSDLVPPTEARGGPVAWRVKDYADGWMLAHTLDQAKGQAGNGNLIQPLYASHPPAREAVDDVLVEAGARAIDALWSEQQARHYVFEDTDREYQAHCRDTARAALLAALQVKP